MPNEIHLTDEARAVGYSIPAYDDGRFIGYVNIGFHHSLDQNFDKLVYSTTSSFERA